ncbi:MAG: DUF2868 domain-containing protein [Chthoniobacter sp.]
MRQLSGRNLQVLLWAPLMAVQGFGVFWNGGVLFALLARLFFTDLAFGWESTIANGPQGMYAIAHTLATPWLLLGLNFCPTLEQIEHSWFHYQPAWPAWIAGRWWPGGPGCCW